MEQHNGYSEELNRELTDTTAQLQEIAVLDTETGDWIIKTTDFAQAESDENSQADATEEADTRISILAEMENRYRLIIHALQKIEQGTYGLCEISGEPIESARLQIDPAARTCIAHKEEGHLLPLP